MDITKLSLTELKAMAFDCIATIEINQKNLQVITAEMQKRSAEVKEEVKNEEAKN